MVTATSFTIGDLLGEDEASVIADYYGTVGAFLDAAETPPLDPMWRRDNYPLRQFVREAWDKIEPQPFKPGWHIDAICDHLQAVTETAAPEKHQDLPAIQNLLINVPPRCSKSIIVACMWPSWTWISWTNCTFLYVSYSQQLALRDAEKARQLMQTNWYQSRWGDRFKFSSTQGVKSFYYNNRLGSRFSTSINSAATGFGADIVCLPYFEEVTTEQGPIPIGEIVEKELDLKVLSVDPETLETSWQPITAYHRHEDTGPRFWLATEGGNELRLTADHPIFTLDRAYVAARKLLPGSVVLEVAHKWGKWRTKWRRVTELRRDWEPERYVYNLTVAGHNNYVAARLLTHNCGDDLHAAQEDHSETRAEIESAKAFWRDVIPSRSTDPTKMAKVVVGQRIAVDDVSEMLIQQGNYQYLCIPMELTEGEGKEVASRSNTALNYIDPRFETGDLLLQGERFTPEVIQEYKFMERRYHAQYQQNPVSDSTTLYPRHVWNYFHDWPDVDWFDTIIQSWDFRFGDAKTAQTSYVAGHVWAKRGPDVYLLDRYYEQSSFTECIDAVLAMTRKWPTAYGKLIENRANGPAIVSTLRRHVAGLILVNVGGTNPRKGGGSKYQRAEAVAWVAKAGNAWLPHQRLAPWVNDYVNNMFRFPAEPDDDTDATSQAWRHLVPLPPAKDETLEAAVRRRQLLEQKVEAMRWGAPSGGHKSGTRA